MIILIIIITKNKLNLTNKQKTRGNINHVWKSQWTIGGVGLWLMIFKTKAASVLSTETMHNYVFDYKGTYASHQ